jgi:hypothetical protein
VRLIEAAEPTFARHETFHPRYGWFRKAYVVAREDPQVFGRDEAPVVIGVGKNMVRAIRFWGLAAKLIVEHPEVPRALVPTRFGHALFGDQGWDPFMEDPGTLWLLHWALLSSPSRLPVWWLVFNEFHPVEFTDDDLELAITGQLDGVSDWASPHQSSVKKDISALLRTYAPAEVSRRVGIEDVLDCPLRELGMIQRSAATGRYRFTLGHKTTLSPEILAYAALDYAVRGGNSSNTISLSRLAYESGGPGRVFKLSEPDLLSHFESVVKTTKHLNLSTPAGAPQLSWSTAPGKVAVDLLNAYYQSAEDHFEAGPDADQPMDAELLEYLGVGFEGGESFRALMLQADGV